MEHHYQTPVVTETAPISLETKMTKHWVDHRASCELGIINADYNLGRIALIYGGQMHFDFD